MNLTQQAYIDRSDKFKAFSICPKHKGKTFPITCDICIFIKWSESYVKDTLVSITEARIKDRKGRVLINNGDETNPDWFYGLGNNSALEEENKADRDFINWVKEQ